jgi:hypothetical protein
MFGVVSIAVGLGLIAYLAKEHIDYGGKITVGGVIFIMLLAIGWVSHVDKIVECNNGNQAACDYLDQDTEVRDY